VQRGMLAAVERASHDGRLAPDAQHERVARLEARLALLAGERERLGRELVAAKDARGQRRAREQRAVQDAGELRVEMRGAVAEQSLARLDAVELEARETEMRICRRRRLRRRQTPAQRILRGECQTSRTAQLRARLTSVPGTTCTVA
jgi:hypothetical protein